MVSGRRAFSVPVGKLRNKNSRCKGGSSSGSCSRSRLLNRLLKKNNKELAYALAKQKERNKITTDENINLMSSLHDAHLETIGWKNKFLEKQKSLSVYRDSVVKHINEAVRYSVLLTESLKLAMIIPSPESSSAVGSVASTEKVSDRSNSIVSPLKLRVNPMVSGHTIRYPTVNLKRLDVEVVERITDENNEEASEDIVERSPERSQPCANTGLSTCIEEDEEVSQNQNVSSISPQEVHEDSFRRRTVSFRNRTLDKSKQMWQIEVADSTPAKLTENCREALSQLNNTNKRECSPRKYSSDWECVAVPEGLNWLNPVVALNDISEFLRYSNSVNVLEMAQLGSKILTMATRHCENPSENEKENIISNKIVSEPVKLKRKTRRPVASKVGNEDPLEGSSWMYQDIFIKPSAYDTEEPASKKSAKSMNKKINLNDKKTRKRKRDPESDSTPKNVELEKDFNMNLAEKKDSLTPGKVIKLNEKNNVDQEPPLSLDSQRKSSVSLQSNDICCESLNMAQIRNDVRNNLVLQSTPLYREGSSSQKTTVSPSSMSPNFGSHDQSRSIPSLVSPKLSSLGAAGENMIDDCSSPSFNDAKLLPNAFVTVRVKRLKNLVDSEDEKQLIDNPVVETEIGHVSDSSELDSNGFNGFNSNNITIEKARELREGIGVLSSSSGIATTESTR
ncbi:hypothetical protein J437_LFUL000158 [Ladona fulva]|uniref:Uncharacterized protein n=1 Tax=Ladona fulva TaxID=123851 RepID=A0A8K0P2Q5_LADFU|nr:hypothetical protein J437_LFUL000158 [Ladona fulva]